MGYINAAMVLNVLQKNSSSNIDWEKKQMYKTHT